MGPVYNACVFLALCLWPYGAIQVLCNARGVGVCVTQRYVALQGSRGLLVLMLRNACIYFTR